MEFQFETMNLKERELEDSEEVVAVSSQ